MDSFGFGFALAVFGRCLKFSGSCTYLSEVVVSSAGSSTTRAARYKMEKKPTKNRSRIYDLGVVPTRGNKQNSTWILGNIKFISRVDNDIPLVR